MDGRQNKPHLLGELTAQGFDPIQQRAALPAIHQTDEAVSYLDIHEIERDHLRAGLIPLHLRGNLCRKGFRDLLLFIDLIGHPCGQAAQGEKCDVGQPRHQTQREQNA